MMEKVRCPGDENLFRLRFCTESLIPAGCRLREKRQFQLDRGRYFSKKAAPYRIRPDKP